ncbi:MAG: FHA domain-containing protein [Pirellulales bacterium]|nr:FHA domain-containing protein [Pirellulales bacterium]
MKAKLISLDGWMSQRKIPVPKLPAILGRGPHVAIRIDDRWASRYHCEIDEVAGTLVVRDLGSTHGTFVNGHAVTEAHLKPGDRLTVGVSSFQVQYRQSLRPSPTYLCKTG